MSNDVIDKDFVSEKPKKDLDTANTVLSMGIVSLVLSVLIVGGLFSLGGLVVGIMAIVKGKQGISLFNDYPNDYTKSSLSRTKAGFVCGIIGVSLWGLAKVLFLWVLSL